ncbi:MAG TPA: universal stress protein [Candidatus Angelobacter sp.]|nr:universal stress protein [Candidatus Angelobacter sp.]
MRILLAVDGSKCSEAAVEALLHQYKPLETEVLILSVVESVKLMPMSYGFGAGPIFVQDYAEIAQQWRKEGEALLARTAAALRNAGFIVSTRLEEGDARGNILDCAKNWRPDLILLGSHGWRGFDRFMLGSVSDAVARHAPCSVEIVRSKADATA